MVRNRAARTGSHSYTHRKAARAISPTESRPGSTMSPSCCIERMRDLRGFVARLLNVRGDEVHQPGPC